MTIALTTQRNAPDCSGNQNDKKIKRQPSAAAKQRVRDAFDADKLIDICTTWDFANYAHRVDLPAQNGRERFFYYKDNGADVLGIAHLDSVQQDISCSIMDTASGLLVASGSLDDRLGAYVILELLPKLGITCDWLLTTDEEIGQSTADEFYPEHKTYNWMFQFDRGGTDVVMYDYETNALCDLVEASGARVGQGSFSDICMLDHLGVAGFNWGVGYQDYHGPRSHAWLEDTFRMVARFVKFHAANATDKLEYDPDRRFEDDEEDLRWMVQADCGHWVNFDDENTFVESGDGRYIDCTDCAFGIDVDYGHGLSVAS